MKTTKNKETPKSQVKERTRRSNGEGSIYQRADGRWAGYVTLGYGETGKRVRKSAYGKTQAEVAKKLTEISGRLQNLNYSVVDKMTFGQIMKEWLLVFKKSCVTSRTFEGIFRNFKLHIEPFIGNMKIYDIDTMVLQKLINKMIDDEYAVNTIKKNKQMLCQFFDYAIDSKLVNVNPGLKIKVQTRDKKNYTKHDQYKALTPDVRIEFIKILNKDSYNFIKPLCYVLMFAGLRIGEAIALQWKNVNFEQKTLKVERAVTQSTHFDEDGKVTDRITIISDTKSICSVREIPVADIVLDVLKEWKEKQTKRQQTDRQVTAELTNPNSFIFGNDDGSVRTYTGCRKSFNRFKKKHNLQKYHIHFHGLRHTFSNMLFEMNENPKVIQQLLGHRDVKTTITVYNSVDSEYVRSTTDKFNEKLKQDQMYINEIARQEDINEQKANLLSKLNNDEFDDLLQELIIARKNRQN